MFSIFRRNKEHDEVPEWASFFDSREYAEFLKAIDTYFQKKKISYTLDDGVLIADTNDFGFANLGLINVAQVCKQNRRRHYFQILSDHFETMVRANQFEEGFKAIVDDFEKVKKYLGVRLYPNDYVTHIGMEHTVGENFAGDIYKMLVFDLPDTITNVQPDQLSKWGLTLDALFKIAIQNIQNTYPLTITPQQFNEFSIWFVQGDHFFTPNIVFDMNNHPGMIGSHGSLIGIPHRHSVIIYPIESIEVVTAINQLIPTIFGMHADGPGSVSNNLFWYKDGHFQNLPYKIDEEKLQFFPPENFVELLNTLTKNPG